MKKSDFYYDLPQELIAQTPIEPRDASRMMVVNKTSGEIEHRHFYDLVDYLTEKDCLIINDTRVLPARIFGTKDTGATVEFLLLTQKENKVWECVAGPGRRAKPGAVFSFGNGLMTGEVLDVLEGGNRLVRFTCDGNFYEVLDRVGEMPLPHYITQKLEDKERYQPVYSRELGSAAAPTAGLHFTNELLKRNEQKGVSIGRVVLHVGLGTFPVATKFGRIEADDDWTSIFIYPGYRFKCIDALITNFHLPESTLIMLVCAFAGYENTMNAYKTAVEERYRFFSFGDSSFFC